jgi:hypothetical protein
MTPPQMAVGMATAAPGDGDTALTSALEGWLTPALPPLVNQTEAAAIGGVSKATLIRWREPGTGEHGPDKTYMIPPAMAGSTPVWARADIERFFATTGRQRAAASA